MNRKEREMARDALLAQAVEEIKELKEMIEELLNERKGSKAVKTRVEVQNK